MCGRFTQHFTWQELHEFYDLSYLGDFELEPAYNISPSQMILGVGPQRILRPMRWGLVPSWWKKPLNELPSTFNARAEGLPEKPMFRAAFKRHRCLIPASGFFEWTGDKGNKQPWYISGVDAAPLTFAGLYDFWEQPDTGEKLLSGTIVTCAANRFMKGLHSRMPVILGPDDQTRWLEEPDASVLKPCRDEWLKAYPAPRIVNDGRYQGTNSIRPDPSPAQQALDMIQGIATAQYAYTAHDELPEMYGSGLVEKEEWIANRIKAMRFEGLKAADMAFKYGLDSGRV